MVNETSGQGLEEVLAKIERLRGDLSAEIPEQGHYESTGGHIYFHVSRYYDMENDYYEPEGETWVVDKPAEPDTQKRESARQQLQEISQSPNYLSVRYISMKAIGIRKEEIDSLLEKSVDTIINTAQKTETVKVIGDLRGPFCPSSYAQYGAPEEDEYSLTGWLVVSEDEAMKGWVGASQVKQLEIPTKDAIDASRDLDRLYNDPDISRNFRRKIRGYKDISVKLEQNTKFRRLRIDVNDLKLARKSTSIPEIETLSDEFAMNVRLNNNEIRIIYQQSDCSDLRVKAGKALGYSPLRIWSHEHPIAATLSGIAATGAASGLGYMVYQYLTR